MVAQPVLMTSKNHVVHNVLNNVKLVSVKISVLNVLMVILVSLIVHLLQPEFLLLTFKISQLVPFKLLTVPCNVYIVNNSEIIVSLNAQKTEKLFHIVTVLILTMPLLKSFMVLTISVNVCLVIINVTNVTLQSLQIILIHNVLNVLKTVSPLHGVTVHLTGMMLHLKMVKKLPNVKNVLIDVPLVLPNISVKVVLLTEKDSLLVTVNQVSMKMLLTNNVIHVHTTVKLVPMPKLVYLVMIML